MKEARAVYHAKLYNLRPDDSHVGRYRSRLVTYTEDGVATFRTSADEIIAKELYNKSKK